MVLKTRILGYFLGFIVFLLNKTCNFDTCYFLQLKA